MCVRKSGGIAVCLPPLRSPLSTPAPASPLSTSAPASPLSIPAPAVASLHSGSCGRLPPLWPLWSPLSHPALTGHVSIRCVTPQGLLKSGMIQRCPSGATSPVPKPPVNGVSALFPVTSVRIPHCCSLDAASFIPSLWLSGLAGICSSGGPQVGDLGFIIDLIPLYLSCD